MANTAPLLQRKKLLGGSEETTWGTSPSITSALTATIYDAKMVPGDLFSAGKRAPHGHYQGNIKAIAGAQVGTLTFRQELCYGDAFVAMLTGAGYVLATGTYSPTTNMANLKPWSFRLWEDGRYKPLAGAMGTCQITGSSGGLVYANWTWQGVWGTVSDEAMKTQAPIATTPYRAKGATLTIGAAAIPYVGTFTVDLGVSVEPRMDVEASAGVLHYVVAGREPKISLDTEARTGGAPFAAMLAGTEAAFSLALEDATGNSLTIAAPKVQYVGIGDEEREGILIDPVDLQCNASSGDDELTFTAAAAE